MMHASSVPAIRVAAINTREVRPGGSWVLYWMSAARRTVDNFGLERAVSWARELKKPLVVLEAIRAGYPFACDRFHRFVIDGMADNDRALEGRTGVVYHPYVEPAPGKGKGLLGVLAAQACVVVADDFPCFFLPRALAAAALESPVRFETVDGNGLLPLRAISPGTRFTFAHQFRRFQQRTLPAHLASFPQRDPLAGPPLPALAPLPRAITDHWPRAPRDVLEAPAKLIASLPIDHRVSSLAERGGMREAEARLTRFVEARLSRYEERSNPDSEVASELSAHLHFGHVSAHRIFSAIAERTGWKKEKLSGKPDGRKEGYWNASPAADGVLDQLTTWRELGFARCAVADDYASYDALPAWARQTLENHAKDPRPHRYSIAQLESAATSDDLWNAAQRQLMREGRIQNYLRMIWGKRLLEWTEHPREAYSVLIELNDRWATDGRDPNTYTNIGWIFGQYDRPWAPERPIFGTVRYMSSAQAKKKLELTAWLAKNGPAPTQRALF